MVSAFHATPTEKVERARGRHEYLNSGGTRHGWYNVVGLWKKSFEKIEKCANVKIMNILRPAKGIDWTLDK